MRGQARSRTSRRGHRGEDPAAGGEDLEVAGAALAEEQLALARAREQQVRVGVHEPGRHGPSVRVQAGEPACGQPLGRERGHDGLSRPHRDDASLPARHRRVVLVGAHPQAAAHRDDLGGAGDQEPGREVARAATAVDDTQGHVAHHWGPLGPPRRPRNRVVEARRSGTAR